MFNSEYFLNYTGLFWQYPAITERQFYEQNKNDENYVGIPWATVIDKNFNINIIFKLLKKYMSKEYYTCCQHISFKKLIPLFKALNITKVYVCHKEKQVDIIGGVKLLPCPIYAVNIEDEKFNKDIKQNKNVLSCNRNILFSFVGGYNPKYYMSNIRKKIYELDKRDDIVIQNTGEWHLEQLVYHPLQNNEKTLNINDQHMTKTHDYNKLLLKSRYTLAPSGSGPNSIRFWEALGAGSIPVLFADTLELPEHELWDETIVRIAEKDVNKVYEMLEAISEEEEKERRENCLTIYKFFKDNYKGLKQENNNEIIPNVLFTSYLCSIHDPIVTKILNLWKLKNPDFEIKYFSDDDVDMFFDNHSEKESYKKLKNGVAKADFFRICYINKFGGYWFDIDIEPVSIFKDNLNNIALFDVGFKNISYMLIGGKKEQELFFDVIAEVSKRITDRFKSLTGRSIMDITGPRIIQEFVFSKMNIINKDGCFPGTNKEKIYLNNSNYEFSYKFIDITNTKIDLYSKLQKKYNKLPYCQYNFI